MVYKIYLVEDEKSLNVLLRKYLEKEGYQVTSFFDGNSALKRIKDNPHLWILDIMLPDTDGYQLIAAIKMETPKVPVIFMSARNEELDRVTGLELGSDDYLSKPFLPRELVIRTNRLLDRIYPKNEISPDVGIVGDISPERNIIIDTCTIHVNQRHVVYKEEEIPLTNKEFELLLYMAENINCLLSREQLLITIWGDDYYGSDRVVDDTIRRIRRKIESLNIETVYGYGYKLLQKDGR